MSFSLSQFLGLQQTSEVKPPSPEEAAYLASQQALAAKQLEILGTQTDFQKDYMTEIKPIIEAQLQLYGQQLAAQNDPVAQEIAKRTSELQLQTLKDTESLAPLQRQLAEKQMRDALNGYAATPEQIKQIDTATQGALESGRSDLLGFQEDAVRQLREQLSPALGLRPTDTPIIDRGQLIAKEGTRQFGQLTRDLSVANANAKLNYPLTAAGVTNASAQFQQGLGLASQQFQAQLEDSARTNRLRLLSGGTDLTQLGLSGGIGLAGASRPNPLSFQRSKTFDDPSAAWETAISGAAGISAVLAASDARVKEDVKTVRHDSKGRRWVSFRYIGEHPTVRHVGVIAQEIERTDPEAVLTNGLGLKFVDYSKII